MTSMVSAFSKTFTRENEIAEKYLFRFIYALTSAIYNFAIPVQIYLVKLKRIIKTYTAYFLSNIYTNNFKSIIKERLFIGIKKSFEKIVWISLNHSK